MSYLVASTRAAVGVALLEASKTTAGLVVTLSLSALAASATVLLVSILHPEIYTLMWARHG